jgi:hypothetical protein
MSNADGRPSVMPLVARPSAAYVRALMTTIAASEIVASLDGTLDGSWTAAEMPGDQQFDDLMTDTDGVNGEVLRWIASHVNKKRMTAH